MTVATEASRAAIERALRTRWLAAWVDLHVQPESFFQGNGRRVSMWLPIYVVGLWGVFDQIDQRFMLSAASGGSYASDMTWVQAWFGATIGACVAGPLSWLFGGWLVRLRAGWCGAVAPDKDLCRRISVLTNCIAAVPGLTAVLLATLQEPSPRHYALEGEASLLIGLGTIAWSSYASYRAVLGCMTVRPVAARAWFLIVPLGFYGLVFFGAAGAALAGYW